MSASNQRNASILLAVFLIGGLAAPLVHRFEHIHREIHRHGAPSADMPRAHTAAHSSRDFLVEEQTPPHDLSCDLCARLACDAAVGGLSLDPLSAHAANRHAGDRRTAAEPGNLSSIRAPPASV